MGRPAIFVPYPRRGQNDQTANARFLQDQGAALVVEQGHDFKDRLWKALQSCFTPPILKKMALQSSRLRSPSGLATIGDQIEDAIR
ncbi:MAG: hypothetical protein EBZ49_08395 [Proteobacteria bacterium]|nr:hypothetical protein [Pseudomonadota bacterium]